MRARLVLAIAFAALGVAAAGCNSLLGNDGHHLAPEDGGVLSGDSAALDGGDDGAEGGTGGTTPPTSGGIYSVGRVPDEAGVHTLPDGAVVTVTDDGFEFGEMLCNGKICVTGGITP
jgi:hypothetical protein